jgi:protease-4
VSPDNALAVDVNPSALGALDTWSLTASHVEPGSGSAYSNRETSLFFASPFGSGFALGAGVDVFRNRPDGFGRINELDSYNAFVLGAALSSGPSWSLGSTWRVRSARTGGENSHSADVALSFRPAPTLGFSLMGRDLALEAPVIGNTELSRSGVFAATVRPLGDDRIWVELGSVLQHGGDFGARVAGGVMIPWVGRLAASAERSEVRSQEVWTFVGGLDVRLANLSVAPALHGAKGEDDLGWSLLVDVHGRPREGVPSPRYVAKIPVQSLTSRGLLRTIGAFDRALRDKRVVGVLLKPQETGAGLAVAQEVRLMISALKARGKHVTCHLESPSGSEYYLCAGADRVTLDPAGTIRLMGLASESIYFGEFLRDWGVRADFVRIGAYKSAPEQFTNRASSDPAREQRGKLLDDNYRRLVSDLALDLKQDEASIRSTIDRGPFAASEALRDRLVAATIDAHDVDEDAREVFGSNAILTEQDRVAAAERFGPTGQIAVVLVDGSIVDGDNVDVPFLDLHMTGGRTISKTLDDLASDSRIRAIVLRIDSPGGAVTASDQIWRAVKRARQKKPVIASMGSVAASGGYYAAAPATEIWASPSTITGSIGVFYGKIDVASLFERYGVHVEHERRGQHAGADSLFRPFSDEERAALTEKVRIWYRQFVERVAEGRRMPIEKVDALARGHVYSGDAALENGLVDQLGGFGAALARARELAHLGPEAEVIVLPERPSSLLDYVTGGRVESASPVPMTASLKAFLARAYVLSSMSGVAPMALWEGPTRIE